MSTRFNTVLRNRVLLEYRKQFASGQLRIYSSTLPLGVNDPVGGVLLAVCQLGSQPFTTPVAGVMEKDGVWVAEVIATGTAGWFRIFSPDFESWIDGTVTLVAGGGTMEVNDLAFVTGNVVLVNSVVITQPES